MDQTLTIIALAAAVFTYFLWRIERHLHDLNGRIGKSEGWQDDRDDEAGRERGAH